MDSTRTLPGSNRLSPPTDPDALKEFLAENHTELAQERDRLALDFSLLPPVITTPEEKNTFIDVISRAGTFLKKLESTRETAKSPFWQGGKIIDGFFNVEIGKPVIGARTTATAELGRFMRAEDAAKQEAARKLAEQARREQEEREAEARRLAALERRRPEVERDQTSFQAQHQANEAGMTAEDARRVASAKPAERVRTRTEGGGIGTLAQHWDFEVEDTAKVPSAYKVVDETLLRSAMREAVKLKTIDDLKIPGVRFFMTTKPRVL